MYVQPRTFFFRMHCDLYLCSRKLDLFFPLSDLPLPTKSKFIKCWMFGITLISMCFNGYAASSSACLVKHEWPSCVHLCFSLM